MMTSRAEPLDDSLAGVVFAVVSSVLAAAFVMVALRIYARAILISKFGIDDWASVISFVFIAICGSVVAWNTRNGLGRHLIFLTHDQIEAYMKCFYISIVFYNVSLGAIKATLLLQYYRVFPLPTIRKVILVVGVIVGMWCVSQVLFIIFVCTPVSAFWTRRGTCVPNLPGWHINAAGNIITDVVILILPLPVINSLTLGMRQKIILFGIFCIGFFTCAISFVRIRFLRLSPDFTLTNVEAACWSVGELCAGLTCACLPTIRPVFSHHFPGFLGTSPGSSQKTPELGISTSVSGIMTGPTDVESLPRPKCAFFRAPSRGELVRQTSDTDASTEQCGASLGTPTPR